MLDLLMTGEGLAAIAFGYLAGSIPFGLLLTKAAGLGDVRKIGSGNIGATNVLRTGNKGLAAATLLLDALKATVAVYLVHSWLKSKWGFVVDYTPGAAMRGPGVVLPYKAFVVSAMAGVAAFVGHIYPIWLGFKGGKGVATYIGAMLGFFWPSAVFFCAVWLLLAFGMRYSSLAALGASIFAALYPFLLGEWGLGLLITAMAALVFYKHEANIRRLLAGTEPKIGQK